MKTEAERRGGADVVAPTERLREHLRVTEEIIRCLRKDLNDCRSQNEALTRERNDFLRLLAAARGSEGKLTELESERAFLMEERDRLADELRGLTDERDLSKTRCASLADALAREQANQAEARDIIIYLEAQIVQLEAIVDLLRAQKELR